MALSNAAIKQHGPVTIYKYYIYNITPLIGVIIPDTHLFLAVYKGSIISLEGAMVVETSTFSV